MFGVSGSHVRIGQRRKWRFAVEMISNILNQTRLREKGRDLTQSYCSYGECRPDCRHSDRSHMPGVFFIPFPKLKSDIERCRLWVKRSGRPHTQLNVDKITNDIYVCSKHFNGRKGPMVDYPDILSSDPNEVVRPRKRVKSREPDYVTTFPVTTKRKVEGCSDLYTLFICERTRQIIRYRATATLRRPKMKQYTALKWGGFIKPTGTSYNFDKVSSGAPDGRFGK